MATIYHIIIADDTDMVRNLITRVVARTYRSARITAVADGQDALNIFLRDGADLVITNNNMRRLTGLALIAVLRRSSTTLPIVMISGDTGMALQARRLGVSAFIAKPFTPRELSQTLLALLPVP